MLQLARQAGHTWRNRISKHKSARTKW